MNKRVYSMLAGLFALLSVLALAPNALAAGGRVDYDLDNDRLIEINDLLDLVQTRNNLSGQGAFYGKSPSNLGCPGGCIGYELTVNLNYDTNGNGFIDEGDPSWNDGQGTIPIGANSGGGIVGQFTAVFEGNGHQIANLMCRERTNCGLFAEVSNTTIRNLKIVNFDMSLPMYATGSIAAVMTNSTLKGCSSSGKIWGTTSSGSGGLVGSMTGSTIDESYSTAVVAGGDQNGGLVGIAAGGSVIKRSFSVGRTSSARFHMITGGLAGTLDGSTIDNCFATGNIGETQYGGGLVGSANAGSSITRSFATGRQIGADAPRGGLVAQGTPTVTNTYWATDLTGQTTTSGGGTAATAAQLKCPIVSNDTACSPNNMYATWNTQVNSANGTLWSQGTNQQLPGLNIQGATFRDADGDGVLDGADYNPDVYAASADSDGDGSIDRWKEGCDEACRSASGLVLDQFPINAAASLDLDLDGRPEAWNSTCNAACQSSSGLNFDSKPGDQDNDGMSDLLDPNDNADAVTDADKNSNGLVDIETLDELYYMRYQTRGHGQRKVDFTQDENGVDLDTSDTSGCPPRLMDGVLTRMCRGYELLNDLDFDTNHNGSIDPGDQFYNAGQGWAPIGHQADQWMLAFQTLFEGNGHVISNLLIYSNNTHVGLFGATRDATIQNLGLDGPLMQVVVTSEGGALIGNADRTTVREVYTTGTVFSYGYGRVGGLIGSMSGGQVIGSFSTGDVALTTTCNAISSCGGGGLVGSMFGGRITASFSTAPVYGDWIELGGLVGSASAHYWTGVLPVIEGSYSTGFVNGDAPTGGLVGVMPNTTTASYWATDNSGQATSAGSPVGATLSQLKFATADNTLFVGWKNYADEDGVRYWNFGTDSQLPGLCFEGKLYGDADANGLLDAPGICGPCNGLCNNPDDITWSGTYNNPALGTAAVCLQTTQSVSGGNCGNFAAARVLRVNGQTRACTGANWSSIPAQVNGGYCISATPGNYSNAFLTLW